MNDEFNYNKIDYPDICTSDDCVKLVGCWQLAADASGGAAGKLPID